jgi:hypothetical protein
VPDFNLLIYNEKFQMDDDGSVTSSLMTMTQSADVRRVLAPGEWEAANREARLAEGIPLDAGSWQAICAAAIYNEKFQMDDDGSVTSSLMTMTQSADVRRSAGESPGAGPRRMGSRQPRSAPGRGDPAGCGQLAGNLRPCDKGLRLRLAVRGIERVRAQDHGGHAVKDGVDGIPLDAGSWQAICPAARDVGLSESHITRCRPLA